MVSKEWDGWIREQDQTIWIAGLENGETIYQDDYRPGMEPQSAWLRLRKYCYENDTYITSLVLKFRSHTELVAENAEGYYFARGVMGSPFWKQSVQQYVTGVVNCGNVPIRVWRVPELIVMEEELRELDKVNKECLIVNPNIHPHLVVT